MSKFPKLDDIEVVFVNNPMDLDRRIVTTSINLTKIRRAITYISNIPTPKTPKHFIKPYKVSAHINLRGENTLYTIHYNNRSTRSYTGEELRKLSQNRQRPLKLLD